MPEALETDGRMQRGQAEASRDDHEALEDHEHGLVASEQRAVEAARELGASIHAAGEDSNGGDGEADQEAAEEARVHEIEVGWVPGALAGPDAFGEPGGGEGEDDEGDDLEDQADQHEVLADVSGALGVGGGGDAAAGGLEKEADEIAGGEDDGVGARLEVGEVGAVDDDNAGEAQVDGGAEQSGGNGQGDEVYEEVIAVKGRVVKHDPSNVADDLEELKGLLVRVDTMRAPYVQDL